MKKQVLFVLLVALMAITGCMDNDVYKGPKEEPEKEFNDFDFSTVASATSLEVSYLNCGVEAAVYFELYDEMPVVKGEYSYTKRDDVTPLFAAYTDNHGVFKGNVELPAYLKNKKVYIYTPAFYAQTLIEAETTDGAIVAKDEAPGEKADTRVVTSTDKAYDSYMVTDPQSTPEAYKNDTRWKTWLGDYDKYKNGEIKYKYKGNLAATDGGLYTAHTQVFDTNGTCPEEFRSYTDMYVNEKAEVAVTFLGQNTCWNCSMGYYYYKEGEKPASLNQTNVIMLFPNTQDGLWSNATNQAKEAAGIDRGTAVQLKYYPDINNPQTGTTTFPAGYRIGFVIANNAWSNRLSSANFQRNNRYRAATSEGLSVNNNGTAYSTPRTAAYKYRDYIMVSFEDYTTDNNFSDIVITMKSNPVDAITDVPVVDPENNRTTANVLKGIYAFEDQWPSQGDYDMNDVLVRHNYEKTFDKDNKIYSEAFIFKTFQNFARNDNGLACRLDYLPANAQVKCEMRKEGETEFTETAFAYEQADKVFLLTDNVKENMGAEYKVTVTYQSPETKEHTAGAFIYKNTADGKRWEVHTPKENPTSRMDCSYFGQEADASKTDQGIYFVREGNYPFAFFLAGATEKDLGKLLDPANESKAIDQLYNGYNGWVTGNGSSNQDWYKK